MARQRGEDSKTPANMISTTFIMPKKLHKELKLATIITESTMSEVICRAVREYVTRMRSEWEEGYKKQGLTFRKSAMEG